MTTSTPEGIDTPSLVRKLWSVHEIQQLAYRFAQAHDGRDLDELERLFVPADHPLEFPDFNQANALTTLAAYFQFAGPTILFVANHEISFRRRSRHRSRVLLRQAGHRRLLDRAGHPISGCL